MRFSLGDLVNLEELQRLADANYTASGMPVGIIDAGDGAILVGSGWQRICRDFHRVNPRTRARCEDSDQHLSHCIREGKLCEYKCKNGLWDIAIPVFIAERHRATIFLGQFFYEGEQPDREFFRRQAREFAFDEEDYLHALDEVPVFTRAQVQNILEYNRAFAVLLGDLATQNLALRDEIAERQQTEEQRLEMERRMLHAQRLESMGLLAGGIAHDFNNLLMVILGNLDLAMDDISTFSPAHSNIIDAVTATRRAIDLTSQMLAYSGKARYRVQHINLSKLVHENVSLFRSSIARTIDFSLHLQEHLPLIEGDPGKIQQVIINLLTNASEAMAAHNGCINISTGVQECDAAGLSRSRVQERPPAGRFVFLLVEDTGCGMDEATRHRLFDPYFSTKFTGRGLGMAAVMGIVHSHQGAILVDSTPGKGTVVRVLFPIRETRAGPRDMKPPVTAARGTILVVDDENMIRDVATRMLTRLDYAVLTAGDGQQGLDIYRANRDNILCVLMDLSMPTMDGITAVNELRRIDPEVKVILCSGFSEHDAIQRFTGRDLAGFIQKPFTKEKLKIILDRVLSPE